MTKGTPEPAIASIDGVPDFMLESFLRQRMRLRFLTNVPGLSDEEAGDAATATWETEWPDDPEPRTMQAADDVVDDELSYWGEE